ncbi:MAG: YegS/Rv2252/BmrU family lipid kinase [Oscillospiraceae bacterium]|nr:YegS/Rv2252/BmrU family lipid kinase [Oscillospiraceae bacterium]
MLEKVKHLFIVNPIAGDRDATDEVRAKAEKAFEKRDDSFEIYVTKAPMDACDVIGQAAQESRDLRVYACGGDGTFNECVCGAAERENVAVCPFPTGTGNDFCRMFGQEAELYRDLDAILAGQIQPIDLINCNGRWCANICSVGIDARIGADVHKYSKLPIIGGAAAYVVSAAVNVFRGINTTMRIKVGEFVQAGKHALVCACNGRFYGGGFNPSCDARPDDGVLDIYVVKEVSLAMLPFLIGKYAAGRADELPKYVTHLKGRDLSISFGEEHVVNIDGEAIYSKDVDISLKPGAGRLIVPRGMHFFDAV